MILTILPSFLALHLGMTYEADIKPAGIVYTHPL